MRGRDSPSGPLPRPAQRAVASKRLFALALVEATAELVSAVWHASFPRGPLCVFLRELLRRARVSCPMLQLTICYFNSVATATAKRTAESAAKVAELACCKRVFVACLMIAMKMSRDSPLTLCSWQSISGLAGDELRRNELAVLYVLDWKTRIAPETYFAVQENMLRAARQAIMRSKGHSEGAEHPAAQAPQHIMLENQT